MKRRTLFISLIAVILSLCTVFAVGCKKEETPPVVNTVPTGYSILFEDLALMNGKSFNLDAKLFLDGKLVEGSLSYSSSDSSIVSINGNVATANKAGAVVITVTASHKEYSNVATKTVNCTVGSDDGIVPDSHSYTIYISDNVHGVIYDTQKTLNAEVFLDGNKVEDAVVEWTIGDSSIASLSADGTIKAVKVGKTFVEGKFDNLKTIKIPVEVAIPVLDTEINVVLDAREKATLVDSNTVLGNGKVIGKIKDVETGKEISVTNNSIPTSEFRVGEYRYVVYDKNELIGCEVNLVVADYVVDSKLAFYDIVNQGNAKYIAFTTDLSNVGGYDHSGKTTDNSVFSGVLNGLGHKVDGLSMMQFGLFDKASEATFKNISFTNVSIEAGNTGVFFFQATGNVTFDNVFVEVTSFNSSCWSSGALYGFNFKGKIEINNSIIIADGDALDLNNKGVTYCGAISGRAKAAPVFNNSYVISDGFLVATGITDDPHSLAYPKINVLPVIYKDASAFIDARFAENSSIDLSGFTSFWDLSKDVPCFK